MHYKKISLPEKEHLSERVTPGEPITFDFTLSQADFVRDGEALLIQSPSGGSVRLEGFFSGAMPQILVGDDLVEAVDFFRNFNEDLATAMGPAPASSPDSGGVGYYDADPGQLINGVDRLGSLGTIYWPRETAVREFAYEPARDAVASSGDQEAVETEQPASYHTRLVVTATDRNEFSFYAVDEDGNLVTDAELVQIAFPGGAEYFTIVGIDSETGKITVSLTDAGLAALAGGQRGEDLLTVSVDGKEYEMSLVVTDAKDYNAATEEVHYGKGSDLKAEWDTVDEKLPGDPEGERVCSLSGAQVVLGGSAYNRVDVVLFGESNVTAVYGSVIDISASQKGDVYISATENIYRPVGVYGILSRPDAPSVVKTGSEGTITVTVSGYPETSPSAVAAIGNGSSVLIDSPKIFIEAEGHYPMAVRAGLSGSEIVLTNSHGALDLEITGKTFRGEFASAIDVPGGSVKIEGGSVAHGDADSIVCNGNVYVDNNGSLTIASGEADDSIIINGGLTSLDGSHVTLETGSGDDTIVINGFVGCGSWSWDARDTSVTIDTGEGNDTVIITQGINTNGYSWETDGDVRIDTGTGHDAVSVTGGVGSDNSGVTVIDTGDGDDTIALNGKIHPGMLEIRAGEGNDTLILHAFSAEEFNQYYRDWLTGTDAKAMGLERVEVVLEDGGSTADLGWLHDMFGDIVALPPDFSEGFLDSAALTGLEGLLASDMGAVLEESWLSPREVGEIVSDNVALCAPSEFPLNNTGDEADMALFLLMTQGN